MNNKAPKRKNHVSVSVSIPLSLLEIADARAQSEKKSLSAIVTDALTKAFGYAPNVNPPSPKPLNVESYAGNKTV